LKYDTTNTADLPEVLPDDNKIVDISDSTDGATDLHVDGWALYFLTGSGNCKHRSGRISNYSSLSEDPAYGVDGLQPRRC
jgi:hypothetical protein